MQVVEKGSHQELLKVFEGRYAAMWAQQEKGMIDDVKETSVVKVEVEDLKKHQGCGCGHVN